MFVRCYYTTTNQGLIFSPRKILATSDYAAFCYFFIIIFSSPKCANSLPPSSNPVLLGRAPGLHLRYPGPHALECHACAVVVDAPLPGDGPGVAGVVVLVLDADLRAEAPHHLLGLLLHLASLVLLSDQLALLVVELKWNEELNALLLTERKSLL